MLTLPLHVGLAFVPGGTGSGLPEATATLIRSADSMRAAREESFERAMVDMTTNLAAELERFEARIKQDRSVPIAGKDGASGSGALGPIPLLVLRRRLPRRG